MSRFCKACQQERAPEFFGVHPHCKPCRSAYERERRKADPEKFRAVDMAKHVNNRDARLVLMAAYHAKNREARAERERARYEAEKDRIKARATAYRQANPHKVQAWNGKRRAQEARATPAWVDMDSVAALYALAAIYTEARGEPFHVDHVVPLRGKRVSGLHVHTNLQVLPAVENLRKGASLLE